MKREWSFVAPLVVMGLGCASPSPSNEAANKQEPPSARPEATGESVVAQNAPPPWPDRAKPRRKDGPPLDPTSLALCNADCEDASTKCKSEQTANPAHGHRCEILRIQCRAACNEGR
ncbi:MAG: hypothetical protein HOW73_23210 [Polyangiaceae bacterium]|nr:hypothetical protein [Polyangiaceae bacterium]